MSQADSEFREPLRVLNEPSKRSRGGQRGGAGRPPKKKSRLSKEFGAGPDHQKENRDFVARSSHQTGPLENKQWRHCKTERRDRRKYYEELRRQRLEEELAKEEEAARLKWESYEKVCLEQIGRLPHRSDLSKAAQLRLNNQLNALSLFFNLFPPNVPMWEHDLKDNFLGFSFEQFFSKLVPHLEQMFSPLSVKKYNF